jgi:hypothetical protein
VKDVALLAVLLAPAGAVAGPEDEFRRGFEACTDARNSASERGSDNFDCTICGAPVSCTGRNDGTLFGLDITSCDWGALSVGDADDSTDLEALDLGFQLYCVNRSGTLTATRSITARQAVTLDGAFKRAKETTKEVLRGFLPRGLAGALDLSSGEVVGAAVPYGFAYGLGERGRVDVDGDVFFTRSPALTQIGLNAKGYYALLGTDPSAAGGSTFAGVTVPLQFSVTTGEPIDASPGFVLGAGGLAGYSRHALGYDWGVGVAADLVRAGGFQLPTQVVGRFGVPVTGTADLVVQPGLSVDVLAGADLASTTQLSTLAGLQWGAWIVGAQVMYLGDDLFAGGLTVTRTDALSQSVAAGRVVTDEEARAAGKPAQVELADALMAGDRRRARAALERLRPTVEAGPLRDFLDQVTVWVDLEPGQAADQMRTMLAATATYVLIDALDGETEAAPPAGEVGAAAASSAAAVRPPAAIQPARPPATLPPRPAATEAEVDGALARLECARLVGRRAFEGCEAAADDAARAASERQWELAWQAWYGLQVRHGKQPPLEYGRLTREAGAFGNEARAIEAAAARPAGLDPARLDAFPRVQRHPMRAAWFPQVEQAKRARWTAQIDAVAVASSWEALVRELPGAVEATIAFDPASPPALARLPLLAGQARRGAIAEVDAELTTLLNSGHGPTALMAQRVRTLAGRDAASRAATAARAGRLPEAVVHLTLAERLAPGDEAVTSAAVPIRTASEGDRIRALARIESASDRAGVVAALRAAGPALRAAAPLPSDLEDAALAERLATDLAAWPVEPIEQQAARIARLPEAGRPPATAAREALYRRLVEDGRDAIETDVTAGRLALASARVNALRAIFPNEPAFADALADAQNGLSKRRVEAVLHASATGRWATAEVARQRLTALGAREREALAEKTADRVARGMASLVPVVRFDAQAPALRWAENRLAGDHGGWIGLPAGASSAAPGYPTLAGLEVTLRVERATFTLSPPPPKPPEVVPVRRVRANPDRIACDAEAGTRLEQARTAEDATRSRAEALATCMSSAPEAECRRGVDDARREAIERESAAREAAERCRAVPAVVVETPPAERPTAPTPVDRTGKVTLLVRVVASDPELGLLKEFEIQESATVPDPNATDDALSAVLALRALDTVRDRMTPITSWLTERLDAAATRTEPAPDGNERAARAYLLGLLHGGDAARQRTRLSAACPACAAPGPAPTPLSPGN